MVHEFLSGRNIFREKRSEKRRGWKREENNRWENKERREEKRKGERKDGGTRKTNEQQRRGERKDRGRERGWLIIGLEYVLPWRDMPYALGSITRRSLMRKKGRKERSEGGTKGKKGEGMGQGKRAERK